MNCDIYFKTWLSLEISVSFRLNSYHFLMTGWRWNYEGWFSFLFFLFSSSSLFWNSWFKTLGNCLYNILDFSSFISFISRWSFPFQHWHFSKCKPEKNKKLQKTFELEFPTVLSAVKNAQLPTFQTHKRNCFLKKNWNSRLLFWITRPTR